MKTPDIHWPCNPDGIRILVVDDDSNIQLLVRSTLAQLDHVNVAVARDLPGARQELERRRTHILFLDINLAEGASGMDLLQQLAQQEQRPFVVMLTANSTMDNFKQAMDLGAGYFIVKPFNGAKVRAALLKYHQAHVAG